MRQYRIVHVTGTECPELNEAANEGWSFCEWVPAPGERVALLVRINEELAMAAVADRIETIAARVMKIATELSAALGVALPSIPTDRPPSPDDFLSPPQNPPQNGHASETAAQ